MEPNLAIFNTLASASIGFAVIAMVAIVGLSAWREWISLKREQLLQAGNAPAVAAHSDDDIDLADATSRIEVAALKERIRKLEAIADGVDL